MTRQNTSLLGHSYYSSNSCISMLAFAGPESMALGLNFTLLLVVFRSLVCHHSACALKPHHTMRLAVGSASVCVCVQCQCFCVFTLHQCSFESIHHNHTILCCFPCVFSRALIHRYTLTTTFEFKANCYQGLPPSGPLQHTSLTGVPSINAFYETVFLYPV